jgi:hypothetical protein
MTLGASLTPTLRDLVQEAQSLDQVTNWLAIPPVGLRQLKAFYSVLVARDEHRKQGGADDSSRVGRQFLAKKSIDCAKADHLIKDLTTKSKAAAKSAAALRLLRGASLCLRLSALSSAARMP